MAMRRALNQQDDVQSQGDMDLPQMGGFDSPEPESPTQDSQFGAAPDPGDISPPARGGETPREREATTEGMFSATARRRPMEPTPMTGSVMSGAGGMGASQGVLPFNPLPPAGAGTSRRGLLGGQGGLTGGGLGVPFDPTPNQQDDPILGLLQLLRGQ